MNKGLNHFYRLVWNHACSAWVAVGEMAKGRGKKQSIKKSTAGPCPTSVSDTGQTNIRSGLLVASVVLCLSGSPLVYAAPQGGSIQQGQGQITQHKHVTTVVQQSQRLNVDWKSFDVSSQETVNFVQPGRDALAVNSILGSNGSEIHGRINANGQVWLINPNGILFGKGAQINVGGILASTLQEAGQKSGHQVFAATQGNNSQVVNRGNVNTSEGGYIAFIGEKVVNQGQLNAAGGSVAMGAGSEVKLHFAGHQLFSLQVEQSTLDNLADNQGLIKADGGQVLISAGAKDSLLASVVNNTGLIEARSVSHKNGKIILLSGMAAGVTTVAGTLDASAKTADADGGFIETSGNKVSFDDGMTITTRAEQGRAGTWLIDPDDFTIAASGGDITGTLLGQQLDNGHVIIQSDQGSSGSNGDIFVEDTVSWSSNNDLTLSAKGDIYINQVITATGAGGKLNLEYGQSSSAGGSADYHINTAVILHAGANFSTKLGSGGDTVQYQVITSLGAASDAFNTNINNQGDVTSLQGIDRVAGGKYALGADIDASATATWTSGFNPIENGSVLAGGARFEGLGHTIDNLTIKGGGTRKGLYSRFGGKRISNVGLINANISSSNNGRVGGLVGEMSNSAKISNSYVTGLVAAAGDSVGGLVGELSGSATIDQSYSTANIMFTANGQNNIGGLVGTAKRNTKITNSFATGNVAANGKGNLVGGLVGYALDAVKIQSSYATGNVGRNGSGTSIGGLVGFLQATSAGRTRVENSYATGAIAGKDKVGGLIGFVRGAIISNSYSTGTVVGNSAVGGLIGRGLSNSTGLKVIVSSSFWDINTSGRNNSAGGNGKTTAQMQSANTFSSWNISSNGGSNKVWRIYDGYTNPLLRSLLQEINLSKQTVTYNTNAQAYNLVDTKNGLLMADASKTFTNVNGVYSDTGIYSSQQGYDITGAKFEIKAKTIGLTGSRSYDSSSNVDFGLLSLTSADIFGGQNVTLTQSGKAILTGTNAGYVGSYNQNNIDVSNLSLTGADASNYTLVGGTGLITISQKAITLSGSRQYNAGLSFATNLLSAAGIETGDTVTVGGTGAASTNGVDKGLHILSVNGLTLSNNNYVLAGSGHQGTIDAKVITVSGSRQYNAAAGFATGLLSAAGIETGDTVTVGGTGAASTDGVNKGLHILSVNGLTLSDSNYVLAASGHQGTIDAKAITVSGSRQYNAGAGFATGLLSAAGIETGDTVTVGGTGAASTDGVNKGVHILSVNGLTLSDSNYVLAASGHQGTIDAKAITVSGSRQYNAGAGFATGLLSAAGIETGDTVTVGGTGAVSTDGVDKGVHILSVNGLTLSDSNYVLAASGHQGTIDAKAITVSGSRQYNAGAGFATGLLSATGIETGDTVTVGGTGAASTDGVNKGVHILTVNGLTLSDSNYVLAASGHQGTIDAKAITVSGSRQYNAGVGFATNLLSANAVESGDTVTVGGAGAASTDGADKGVHTLSVNGLTLSDSNYVLAATGHQGTIDAKQITVSGSRQYNAAAGFATGLLSANGIETGDTVTVGGSGAASTDGVNKGAHILSVTGITLSDSNYVLAGSGHQGTIDAKVITVSGSRQYNAGLGFATNLLSANAVESGDTVSVGGTGAASTNGADKGVHILSVNGITLSDSNYVLAANGHQGTIDAKAITVSGSRQYNAGADFATNLLSASGIETGDTVTVGGTGATSIDGADKGVHILSVNGLTLSDSNYVLAASGHQGTIDAKAITVSGSRQYNAGAGFATNLLSANSVESGDTVTVGGTGAASTDGVDKGLHALSVNGLTLSDSNYVLAASGHQGTIDAKAIKVSGSRQYNAGAGFATGLLSAAGVETGDTVTVGGTGAESTDGVDKGQHNLSVTGLTLSNSNYALAGSGHQGTIAAKQITVSGTRQYNAAAEFATGLLSANGIETGDTVTVGGTGAMSTDGVDKGLHNLSVNGLTLSNSNYELLSSGNVAEILARELTLSGSRQYNGSTVFNLADLSANNIVAGEALSGTFEVTGADVGNYSIAGIDLGNANYVLADSQVDIAARVISLSGSRVYDGSIDFDISDLSLSNLVGGEQVSLAGSATIANKNVGEQTLLVESITLDDANYTLNGGAHDVNIDQLIIQVQASAEDKNFDNSLSANVSAIGSSDFVDGDQVAIVFDSALFESLQGTDLVVSINGLALTGDDAGNYLLEATNVDTLASIEAGDRASDTVNSISGEVNQLTDIASTQGSASGSVSTQDQSGGSASTANNVADGSFVIDGQTFSATAAGPGGSGVTCEANPAGDGEPSESTRKSLKGIGLNVIGAGVNTTVNKCS